MPLTTPNIPRLTNLSIPRLMDGGSIGTAIITTPSGVGGLPSAPTSPSTIQTTLGQVINTSSSTINTPQITTYFSSSQAFALSASGLKPSTVHTFAFDGIDVTAQCQQTGTLKSGGLTTDATGSINFTFFYSSGLPTSSTDITASQDLVNRLAGKKIGVISNSDGSSSAAVTINIISGTVATYTPPAAAPVTVDLTGLTTTTNSSVGAINIGGLGLGGLNLNLGNFVIGI
jgi:hypothetical protein